MTDAVGSDAETRPTLVRALGTWDATLITIGSVLGTGIFITTGDIAKVLPHGGLILAVWFVGGLVTLAGALSYGELGAMFPRAGGQYHFLKEAYGPVWGFLFGWAAFTISNAGGIAALAVGFGEYLGVFVPTLSNSHILLVLPIGPWHVAISAGQLSGASVIALLTVVNYAGVKSAAVVQNVVTAVKIGAIVGLAIIGMLVPAPRSLGAALVAPMPEGHLLTALGVAMIAVFWGFEGWYGATASAGEMRNPSRTLPHGLILGTLGVTLLYLLMNLAYLRALPIAGMAATGRIAETAAAVLFGPTGARLVSLAVLVSAFGCISSTILWASRIYLPMAEDGVFFSALARVHPRYRTPSASVLAQGAWAIVLTLSGTYDQLYTCVIFAVTLFHAATAAAVFVLRYRRPDLPRPYRAWGYPWMPAAFIVICLLIVLNSLVERPAESLIGVGLVASGWPAYAAWRWNARRKRTGLSR